MDVLYSHDVHNLVCVSKMERAGGTVIFHKEGVKIVKGGNTIIRGKLVNNLWIARKLIMKQGVRVKDK